MGTPVTSCAVPGSAGLLEAAYKMHDPHAERVVLCGLLEQPEAVLAQCRWAGLEKGGFWQHHHQTAYDLFVYCGFGATGPVLLAAWNEMVVRREWLGTAGWREAAQFLGGLWSCPTWFPDVTAWALGPQNDLTQIVWAAGAAARKVKSLADRRRKLHEAAELIGEATNNGRAR